MGDKMNLRFILKYRSADPEIRFLTKPILKPNGASVGVNISLEVYSSLRRKLRQVLEDKI